MNNRMTGKQWAELMELVILEPSGWLSSEDFNSDRITKFEFLNRASQSKIKAPELSSRISASKFRSKIKDSV